MPITRLKSDLANMAVEIERDEDIAHNNQKVIDQKKQAYKLLKAQIAALDNLSSLGYEIKKISTPKEPNKAPES